MKQWKKRSFAALLAACLLLVLTMALTVPAFATGETADAPSQTEETQTETTGGEDKAMASAVTIGLAAAGGAIAMGLAVGKAAESISRQPEAEGKIRTTLMLGLVFIETAIIYALLVVILIIFVL